MEIAKAQQDSQLLFKHRVYAFTFDMMMIGITSKLVMLTYTSFLKNFFHQLRYQVQDSIATGLPVIHFSVLMTVFFSYFFLSLYTSEGKTLGKMVFGLRVYSKEKPELHLGLGESFRRTMGYLVCYATGLFLFALPMLRKDRRGLPDMFSSTEVVFEDFFNEHIMKGADKVSDREQIDLFDEAA
ncbi:MAG: hypothetical protein CME71_05255 [Halobacteriovorax sp.]|mgnify:CR=1 FL=1|nr:hypothetical protein [Halobacteriovorax sp.]